MRISEPKTPMSFHITPTNIRKARKKDPTCCVVAQGLKDACGPRLLEVRVLRTYTYLTFAGGREERFQTPPELREALMKFDDGYGWRLPTGKYKLKPVIPSMSVKRLKEIAQKRRDKGDPSASMHYPKSKKTRSKSISSNNVRLVRLAELRNKK